MPSTTEVLLFTFALLSSQASASVSPSGNTIIWQQPYRSAIIKLSTPGYPYWLMDKAHAPILEEQAGSSYHPQTSTPSAVLLEVRIAADDKTLLLNNEAILPLRDPNVPPKITAYQVPANITDESILGMKQNGVLSGDWKHLTLAWRLLELDYDRLVWADPAAGPYSNHNPTMRFRILGLGAHKRSDVLAAHQQPVLHINLAERHHRSSDAKDRAYDITEISVKEVEDYYAYAPAFEKEPKPCSWRSWRCPDEGALYQEGKPWYRFIWRNRFDQYGRVGSLRHALNRKVAVLREFWEDAGPAMVKAFWILFTPIVVVLGLYVSVWRWYAVRAVKTRVRLLAESDRLLGEEGNDEEFVEEKEEVPPPLPPRARQEDSRNLVDLEAADVTK